MAVDVAQSQSEPSSAARIRLLAMYSYNQQRGHSSVIIIAHSARVEGAFHW